MINQMLCPCHSGDPYTQCCKPFHDGTPPQNALQLMRSRYAAYALNLPDYIIKTTHPKNPHYSTNTSEWRLSLEQFSKTTSFDGLTILEFQETGLEAVVVFTAHLKQAGRDCSFTERSLFEKCGQNWLYTERDSP